MNKNTVIIAVTAVIVLAGIVYFVATREPEQTTTTSQSPVVTSGENPQPGGIHDLPVEPAAAEARKDLAAKLSIDAKNIVILNISETTWNDGCLGLGQAHESCLQALVPGFRVEMLAQGKSYFYRTDKAGESVRAE